MMLRPLLLAALIAAPSTAFAQTSTNARPEVATSVETAIPAGNAEVGQPPQRIRSVTLTPGQQCPKGNADEIVVCSTNDQPYRIPKQFRDSGPIPAQNQSWVNRAQTVDRVSAVAGGLPNTCSSIGTAAGTGCVAQMNQQWADERRAARAAASDVPR